MSLFKALVWPLPFKGYLRRQLIALDQAFNVLTNGDPDETLSSRLGRDKASGSGFADAACGVLDVLEEDHCEKSIEADAEGNPSAHHLGHVITELPRGGKSSGVGPS